MPGAGVVLAALEDDGCPPEGCHTILYGALQRCDVVLSCIACAQADVVRLVPGKLFFVKPVIEGSECGYVRRTRRDTHESISFVRLMYTPISYVASCHRASVRSVSIMSPLAHPSGEPLWDATYQKLSNIWIKSLGPDHIPVRLRKTTLIPDIIRPILTAPGRYQLCELWSHLQNTGSDERER